MCGINGIQSSETVPMIVERIKKMNSSLKHRGPDAEGVRVFQEKVGFGHRRLSIIDLDKRSNQPMESNSGNTVLVYNGEIYNYQCLKQELKKSYKFHTNSDTEVILAAYESKGLDWLLNNVNGMFAFAIFDQRDESVYLIRDRFGIKPLFYTVQNGSLIFSSEIKGILNSGLIEPEFNESAIDEYLGYRFIREPYTFFKNIWQVCSSTYLKFKDGNKVFGKTYWELPGLNFDQVFNEDQIIEATREEVKNAIERWLIADVKVGAYLSGGVDSSLTTAILSSAKLGQEVDTYTIGFKEDGFNEFNYARIVAEKYDTNHREFILEQDNYFEKWESLIEFKDAPLAVPNEIPLAIMSSHLSKDITVVISGEGADELFGGYGRIYRSAFDYKNHINDEETSFYDYFINKYEYTPRKLRDNYLNVDKQLRNYFDLKEKNNFENYKEEENIFRFFQNNHVKGLLNRVDMTTMQTSVEARPPFLDHKLIEFIYQKVPYELKLKWINCEAEQASRKRYSDEYSEQMDIPKYILKKVAELYLPDKIIYRKKMGFPVPLTKWFPDLKFIALNTLKDASWLYPGVIDKLSFDLLNTKSVRSGQLLWMFLNVEIFKKKYFNKKWKW